MEGDDLAINTIGIHIENACALSGQISLFLMQV
jgi:hypothetical protein